MPMSSIDHAIHGSSLIYEVNEILNLLGHGYLKLGAAPSCQPPPCTGTNHLASNWVHIGT